MQGLPAGRKPPRVTAAGSFAGGRALPDDADLDAASTKDIVVSLDEALTGLQRTNNTTSLAMAARYVSRLWWQVTGRGLEFADPAMVTEKARVKGRRPRMCERCNRVPCVWAVQHVEYADHMKPRFVCGRHLAQEMREGEYSEGDEFYVRRVRIEE